MKGQKEFVIEAVEATLVLSAHPVHFVRNQTNALDLLTAEEISAIKGAVHLGIMGGTISYSKPLVATEVAKYSSSMVMHQLKHARELNGGVARAKKESTQGLEPESKRDARPRSASEVREHPRKTKNLYKGINIGDLPEALATYVKKL